jgi:hypothetical protein
LDFCDLAVIVKGAPGDPIRDRPFDCHFSKEKILWSWAKIGFAPFIRRCLTNARVRKELGQHIRDEGLERLQFEYDVLVDVVETQRGFNPGIFDGAIPSALHVTRAATEAEQVEEMLKSGKAFSVSGQWNLCDSRIGNAGVTLKAQKRQLAINEEARSKVAEKRTQAHLKTLEKAQVALEKYSAAGDTASSLNEKDWGDIIRWVLPEAKVDFLLKELKKKDQMLAKLATLPNNWTTYIPSRALITITTATEM